MKTIFYLGLFSLMLLSSQTLFCQNNQNQKSKIMETERNKNVIKNLYENILNKRNFLALKDVISENYSNPKSGNGIEGFQRTVQNFISAFPDIKWTLTEIVAEGNKVFVKQFAEGTQKCVFQNIQPTNKNTKTEGMGIYELKDGKIISHQILTNQLSFLQQLDVIPETILSIDNNSVFFVDRFMMPKSSFQEFVKKMEINRNFIRRIDGFIRDEKMIKEEENGQIIVMTIAIWKNEEYLENAKKLVQEEYKKTNFNPTELYEKLNITMNREIFKNDIE